VGGETHRTRTLVLLLLRPLHLLTGIPGWLDWLPGKVDAKRGASVAYVITEACIGTKNTACVGACPVDCIYDADDHFVINPAECIDCSMCMPECPVEAIYPGDEVPEDMQQYVTRAAEFDYSTTAPGVEINP
jgi:ferredoxin